MIISKWKLKAVVQKSISFFPQQEKVNYFFQKHITKAVNLNDEHFGNKMMHSRDHIAFFNKHGHTGADKQIIELGSGWYPVVPMMMYLSKSGQVTSVDIQSWMTKETQLTTIRKFIEWREKGKLQEYINKVDEKRWNELVEIVKNPDEHTLDSINKTIGLKLLLQDARSLKLEDNSIDLICSNNTFEHIFPNVLEGILKEFKRVIKPNGVMSHFIDMSDHFAHFDHSITIYNFLRYSQNKWKMIDNDIQPQNRLRFKEYLKMYEENAIPIIETVVREGNLEDLRRQKIHTEYQSYSEAELAISHGYIISKT